MPTPASRATSSVEAAVPRVAKTASAASSRPADQPRPARRLPAVHPVAGTDPHHPPRPGPAKAYARRRDGRQAFDAERYKERNSVERCFNKLKAFRAVATRYDKRERIYQGTIDVASIRIWLRDPVM
jgi:hypothetical protein